ncbi:MAG: ABC transporter permease [Betaproteobacteria bacterium]|nr:ABC transporter permease [Betaproteobacteria bacterium]
MRYLLRRLIIAGPALLLLLAAVFGLVQLLPGGPVDAAAAQLPSQGRGLLQVVPQAISPELLSELRRQLGQDLPPAQQFIHLLQGYAAGDLGQSLFYQRPVGALIGERLPVSALLGLSSLLLACVVAIPLGLLQARSPGGPVDRGLSLMTILLYSIPGFVLGAILAQWFAVGRGFGWAPVVCLASGFLASLAFITRASALHELSQPYVWTARAKGLSATQALRGHVLPNVLLPLLSAMPSWFVSAAASGALLIETLFGVEGMGLLAVEAVARRDYPLVLGCVLIAGLVSLVARLLIDLTYGWLDPRVRIQVSSA